MSSPADHELADLHQQLIEDGLDERGRDRLRLLLADPQQRRRLAGLMRIDGLLCEIHRPGAVTPSARIEVRRRGRVRRAPAAARWTWVAAVAALLALATGAWWWSAAVSVPPPLARWSGGGRPDIRAGEVVAGPGTLALADGSRAILAAGTDVMLSDRAGDLRIALGSGRVQVVAAPQPAGRQLSVATDQAVVAVVGTRFSVARDATGTRIIVDEGRVSVRPVRGQEAQLAAGAVMQVPLAGPPRRLPSVRWQVDLADASARQGWIGTPRPQGLGLARDDSATREYAIETWNIRMSDPGVEGVAGFAVAAWCECVISLERPTSIAIQFQMWNQAGDQWLGTVQREAALTAGRHQVRWPLASFPVKQGAAVDALEGMPIRRCAVIAWEDAGIVVERIAVMPGE